jgi:hypothetical protein
MDKSKHALHRRQMLAWQEELDEEHEDLQHDDVEDDDVEDDEILTVEISSLGKLYNNSYINY